MCDAILIHLTDKVGSLKIMRKINPLYCVKIQTALSRLCSHFVVMRIIVRKVTFHSLVFSSFKNILNYLFYCCRICRYHFFPPFNQRYLRSKWDYCMSFISSSNKTIKMDQIFEMMLLIANTSQFHTKFTINLIGQV